MAVQQKKISVQRQAMQCKTAGRKENNVGASKKENTELYYFALSLFTSN